MNTQIHNSDTCTLGENGDPCFICAGRESKPELADAQIDTLPERAVELADHELKLEAELLAACKTNAEEDLLIFSLAAALETASAKWFDEQRKQER